MNNPIGSFSYYVHHSGNVFKKVPFKKIDVYHVVLVMEGSFTYIINGKEITLNENDALLLIPGTERERISNCNHVHCVFFNYFPSKGNEVQSCIHFKNAINNTIRYLVEAYPYNNYLKIKQLELTSAENEKNKLLLQNILNSILIELFDTLKYTTQNPHILKALNYINENLTEPITLNNISNALHLSKEYTARVFKKEMGMTVSEFINHQKLILAKNMLSNDALSLQDVSSKLGYENYCYFSKVFKKQFGVSPLKMKKELS